MITKDSPEWDSIDTALLREFLKTRTGERLLPRIFHAMPALLPDGDTNKILIRSGEVRGWQAVSAEILALAYPPPDPAAMDKANENYPSLSDDSAWEEEKP